MARQPKFNGLGEKLYWSYANLSMFFFALKEGKEDYDTKCYMVRAKIYKGLCAGNYKVHSMFTDQKTKLQIGWQCAYCGKNEPDEKYSLDHILPKSKGGSDVGDNLITVCQSCNSSKRDTDMLEWHYTQGWDVDPWVLRNYLKLVIEYCENNNLMLKHREELNYADIPFNPDFLPLKLLPPAHYLNAEEER